MVKATVVAAAWLVGAVLASGVFIVVLATAVGHREGPMLVALALELLTFGAGAVVAQRVARKARPAGPAPWLLALGYLVAAGLAMVPLVIATALAFDH
jgi:hypothetical protein